TESALVDNLDLAGSIANGLKDLGVKLALNDFGTGYSSLRNLQALPFDELKVDRSFVNSMIESRDSRKIVAAVIGLGQSLKLTTVAEGIENNTQADILRWLGCDIGQGWLYGPPFPCTIFPRSSPLQCRLLPGLYRARRPPHWSPAWSRSRRNGWRSCRLSTTALRLASPSSIPI
ncbi:MAG: EAL domain-containing protein, partial [Edaphobacter sp.]